MRWVGLALLACLSCASDPTQIMVVVRSDLSVPDELDEIRIDVRDFGSLPTSTADLRSSNLPRTLALVHQGGPLGPITVEARGYREGSLVVTRRARVSFVENDARVLVLWLRASCVAVDTCGDEETCTEQGCAGIDIAALPPWTGSVPPADAEPFDAGVEDAPFDTPEDAPRDVPGDTPLDTPIDVLVDVPPDVPPVDGGGITHVQSGFAKCGLTSLVVTLDEPVPAGDVVLVGVSYRDATAGSIAVIDEGANDYQDLSMALGTFVRLKLFGTRTDTALAAGDTITSTFPDSRGNAMVVDHFRGVTSDLSEAYVEDAGVGPSATLSFTPAGSGLAYGVLAHRNNGTVNASGWTVLSSDGATTCGGAPGNMGIHAWFRSVESAPVSLTTDINSFDREWRAAIVGLR